MLIDLSHELDQNLFDRVREFIAVISDRNSDSSEIDFWLDDDTVIFISSPDDDEVYAAEYGDLKGDIGYLAEFISPEFIRTYLSTGELTVVISSSDSGGKAADARVAVVDRSTGLAMIHPENLFDKDRLERVSNIAKNNTLSSENLKSWKSNYALVCKQGDKTQGKEKDLSRNRLVSMLCDIEVHALSNYVGHQVRIVDHK